MNWIRYGSRGAFPRGLTSWLRATHSTAMGACGSAPAVVVRTRRKLDSESDVVQAPATSSRRRGSKGSLTKVNGCNGLRQKSRRSRRSSADNVVIASGFSPTGGTVLILKGTGTAPPPPPPPAVHGDGVETESPRGCSSTESEESSASDEESQMIKRRSEARKRRKSKNKRQSDYEYTHKSVSSILEDEASLFAVTEECDDDLVSARENRSKSKGSPPQKPAFAQPHVDLQDLESVSIDVDEEARGT